MNNWVGDWVLFSKMAPLPAHVPARIWKLWIVSHFIEKTSHLFILFFYCVSYAVAGRKTYPMLGIRCKCIESWLFCQKIRIMYMVCYLIFYIYAKFPVFINFTCCLQNYYILQLGKTCLPYKIVLCGLFIFVLVFIILHNVTIVLVLLFCF